MRNLNDAEIAIVAGGTNPYPDTGTRGRRDGEHGAQIGTAILGLIMSYQSSQKGTKQN